MRQSNMALFGIRCVLVALLWGLAAACSGAPDRAAHIGDASLDPGESANSSFARTGVFDEAFVEDLAALQIAIDLYVEGELVHCARAQGFDYEPRTKNEVQALLMGDFENESFALTVLDQLTTGPVQERSSASSSIEKSMSDIERDNYEAVLIDCRVAISTQHQNPLALTTGWYAEIADDLEVEVASSPSVVGAHLGFEECLLEHGWSRSRESADDRVERVLEELRRSVITRDEARVQVAAIVEADAPFQLDHQRCLAAYDEVVLAAYERAFQNRAVKDRDRAILWQAEVKAGIAPYIEYLEGHS